jgi:glycosyltransferase involved in cell wall biosynthesis
MEAADRQPGAVMTLDVVVPAYNAGAFLRATLDSVAVQTKPPGSIIVVDDSSTDETVGIAQSFAAEVGARLPVRILTNRGPRGPSSARNTGIASSEAEYIALLDADDLLSPVHHAVLLNLLQSSKETVLAFGNSTVFDQAGTQVPSYLAKSGVLQQPAQEVRPGCFSLDDKMFAAMLRNGIFGTSACMFRRDASLRAGLFDESMQQSEDTNFFLRLSLLGRFVFSTDIVAHKRVHDDNLSHPRHKLAFCRGTARSLTKLAAMTSNGLSPAQRGAVRIALQEALNGYLYHASRAGAADYREAASLARHAGFGMKAANPRNLARLLLTARG